MEHQEIYLRDIIQILGCCNYNESKYLTLGFRVKHINKILCSNCDDGEFIIERIDNT